VNGLKERTVRGGFARLCGQAASFALRLASIAILARLLNPNDFGLLAMVTVVTGVYGLFATAGLSSATVQIDTITDTQVSTLFWINMAVGVIVALLCVATAPVLVAFYHEPRLFWVTIALAAGFLFNAAGVQHCALLHRRLRYIALTVIETLSLVASTVVGIAMAFAGFGYWSLVAMALVSPAIGTVCMWLTAAWIPGRPRMGVGTRPMLRFGGTITLNGLAIYVAYNLEKVLLGRFWGADALGIYGRAYQLITIPTDNLNTAIGGVAFSALSRLQHEPVRLKNYFLKGYSLVVSLTIPLTIFCAVFSDDIVLLVLGPKWMQAALIFRLLSPTVLIFGMINPLGWLLLSIGLQGRSLATALVIAPLVISAYFIGLPYGPNGVALAYSAAMTLWLVPHIFWCVHGTMISAWDLFLAVRRPLLSGVVAAGTAFVAQLYFARQGYPLFRLLVGGCVMAGVYYSMLLLVLGQRAFYFDLLAAMKNPSPLDGRSYTGGGEI
jgi:O-antigen/teichoic acid export membrane protein